MASKIELNGNTTSFVKIIENNSENIENMTPEEFQRKLWTWLEERGIFSEMKTHLRRQMIDVLKASEIGQIVSNNQKSKRSLSPKYKAVNLLIAEYLLQQGYQYALSIFSVEDPTLSVLPEKIRCTYAKTDCDDVLFKFINEDVCDILETLGFSKDSREVYDIFEQYNSPKSKDTLIICLIRSMSIIANQIKKSKHIDCSEKNVFIGVNDEKKELYESKMTQTTEASHFLYADLKENALSNQTAHELHQKMQIAFDQELNIIKKNERKKYINNLKSIETEMILKLKKEKEKLRQREIDYQNSLLKEFEVEFQRVQEKERLKEIEIERNLQKDLEIERKKLFDEYRSVAQCKTMNSSVLMELQQASLEAAIKAVQHQSSRLRKKENMLDQKLFSLNAQNVSKNDLSSQNTEIIESINPKDVNFDSQIKTFSNKVTQTSIIKSNTVACQIDNIVGGINYQNAMEIDKAIRTKVTTSAECQTELILPSFENKICELCSNNITSPINSRNAFKKTDKSSVVMSFDQTLGKSGRNYSSENELPSKFDNFEIKTKIVEHRKKESKSNRVQIVSSLQNLLKNLQSENISLKSQNQQQQNNITELLKKHASMSKEVSEARIEAQELSNQLLQLEKVIDANCKSPLEQEDLNLKKSRNYLDVEDKHERKEKPKRTDLKFSDRGLEKIKETLKLLEHEGEELDKSYKAFKLRQIDDSKFKIANIANTNSNIEKNILSTSSSSLLLKHLKDIKLSREKYQTREQSFDSHYNTMDYLSSTRLNIDRAQNHLMSSDRDILQNYIAISKDVNMYNSKNPRAFANVLKQRFINSKKGSLNDINNFPSFNTIYNKTRNSYNHFASKSLEKHLPSKEETCKRKYQFQAPQCLSSSKNQKQLILYKANALDNNTEDDLKISDEDMVSVIKNKPLDMCRKSHILFSNKVDSKMLPQTTQELIDTNIKIRPNVRKWAKLNVKNINTSSSHNLSSKIDSNIEYIKDKTKSANCINDLIDIIKHNNKRFELISNDSIKNSDDNNIKANDIDNNKSQEDNNKKQPNENLTVSTNNIKASDEIYNNNVQNLISPEQNDSLDIVSNNDNFDDSKKFDGEKMIEISDKLILNNTETLPSFQSNSSIIKENVEEKINNSENANDNQLISILEVINDMDANLSLEREQKLSDDNSISIAAEDVQDVLNIENLNKSSDKQDDPNGIFIENIRESITIFNGDFDDKSKVMLDDKLEYVKENQENDPNDVELGIHQISNSSQTSNELILSTSIEISNDSHISVPKNSDEDDAFWK